MWCATSRRQHQLPSSALSFAGASIIPVKSVRDLGIRPGPRHPHRRRSVYAVARTKNGLAVLWCSATTAPDSPICTDGHSPDAGCQAGAVPARLWQQRTGRHISLPASPPTVGTSRVSTADLSHESLLAHY